VASNLIIALLKDTSLAFTLGVLEMTGKAQTLGTLTQHFVESYLALALIYLVISFILQKLLLRAEHRLLRHETGHTSRGSKLITRRSVSRRQILAELELSKGGTGG
jgi:L-cystine transport system permease protein